MFKRKLLCLQYHSPDSIDIHNDESFRALVVWLEDQKIRHYKIEERAGLRATDSTHWNDAFNKYLSALGYQYDSSNRTTVVDWLLGYAVKLEYADNADQLTKAAQSLASVAPAGQSKETSVQSGRRLDPESDEFKAGVSQLAKMFQLPSHGDHVLLFKAISILIEERLSSDALVKAQQEKKAAQTHDKGELIPLAKVDLGFSISDPVLNDAAKVLRLLHVAELRDLQTKINEIIVAVQKLTANPKTDQRLGKVGV
ncbi:RNA transcription, translation and transport factor protein-like [Corticium candelabrum]|uniref:RNA transcription, translation and transport factor protein-like n=1 Tax=Corticium candelabrum TaxID=121492 RepID=UPI002E265B7D|nr:RNA transcription, translation and transport factor protein-like [Corticium candelabrum]